jgi:putative ATP-binding cassette transporter
MLLEILRKETNLSIRRVALLAMIAGLSDALVIVAINGAAESGSRGAPQFGFVVFFALALGTYVLTQRYLLRLSTFHIEDTIKRIRMRLADKIRNADLQPLEKLGRSEIYAGINRDTQAISQAAAPMIIAVQAGMMIFFSIFYIGYQSLWALALTVVTITVGVFMHFARLQWVMERLRAGSAKENEFFDSLTHLLDGFKEVKLSRARSNDLFEHMRTLAAAAAKLKISASMNLADQYLFSQVSIDVLLAVIVFLLPLLAPSEASRILAITAAVQFIAGPLTTLVSALPAFSSANVSMANIQRLEASLEQLRSVSVSPKRPGAARRRKHPFNGLESDSVEMHYTAATGEPLFSIGPLSVGISRGETIFIVGGNGSGKTTFLKVLAGLYYPDAGLMRIDGRPVEEHGYAAYRELFSAIFSDYHLFDRLYGLGRVDESRVTSLLKLMDLQDKTRYVDGRFENQDLSSGQKKRLALIVSILENKPVFVFDEWAADQDPSFRRYFYEEFLTSLKMRGKTVIAATHDDRYFHVADRVLKMEMGRLVADVTIRPSRRLGRGRQVRTETEFT